MTSIFKIQFRTNACAPTPPTVVVLFKGESYEKAETYGIKLAKKRNWALERIEETWMNRNSRAGTRTKYPE